MPKPLLFPITVGEEAVNVKIFHRLNEQGDFLKVATKGAHFIDFNPFDLLKLLRKKGFIENENEWKQDGPLRKFESRTKTSSFIFKKTL